MAIDEYNELIWEAAIPFKALYGKEHLDKKDEGKAISVCFAIKGVKRPEKPKDNGESMDTKGNMRSEGMSGGGMRNASGGMHGGGGHRGGGGNMQNAEHESMFETTKTWKQFGLAYQ